MPGNGIIACFVFLFVCLPAATQSETARSEKSTDALPPGAVYCAAFTPDGKRLLTGGQDHDSSVRLFDVASGKEQLRMLWHKRQVDAISCMPDNKTIVTVSSGEQKIQIADLDTGEPLHV